MNYIDHLHVAVVVSGALVLDAAVVVMIVEEAAVVLVVPGDRSAMVSATLGPPVVEHGMSGNMLMLELHVA